MNFLKNLFGGKQEDPPDTGRYFYVRCTHCQRVLHTRLHPQNDLSLREDDGYEVHKEMMDDRCFRRITLHATFDSNKNLLTTDVMGGVFIDKETWLAEKDLPRRPPEPEGEP